MPYRRDDLIGLMLALLIVFGTVALAHLLPDSRRPASAPAPGAFDGEPTCTEWTDGCIVCQRGEGGVACSTPGIACVPRERQCLRRAGA